MKEGDAFRCPVCGGAVARDAPQRPFCTPRCRMVDLGAWLLGHYRIADPASSSDTALEAGIESDLEAEVDAEQEEPPRVPDDDAR